jgi:manganese/zinc/iron transport system permease protein
MGDALAHSTLPGIALGFLIAPFLGFEGKHLGLLLTGAGVTGLLGVFSVQFLKTRTRLTEDAAIGAVLSVFFGAGIVLLSVIQNLSRGQEGGLHHFIYGQTAAMSERDVILFALLCLLVTLFTGFLLKELRLLCFDDQFLRSLGWSVSGLDLALMILVVVVILLGLQAVGLLLVIALLVVPAVAARFWTERLSVMLIIGAGFGAFSGYVGAALSALYPRMPAGAVIVLTGGVVFAVSFVFAPARGLLAQILRSVRLRNRIALEHLMRSIFESCELAPSSGWVLIHSLSLNRLWGRFEKLWIFNQLIASGLIVLRDDKLKLTRQGYLEAQRLTRNHRLWEEYLLTFGHIAVSHVDYSADLAEHVLSPVIIETLEKELRGKGRLPALGEFPESRHVLSSADAVSKGFGVDNVSPVEADKDV